MARAVLKKVRHELRADKVALLVLNSLEEGFPPALARPTLKMDAKVCAAARKRIVRAL